MVRLGLIIKLSQAPQAGRGGAAFAAGGGWGGRGSPGGEPSPVRLWSFQLKKVRRVGRIRRGVPVPAKADFNSQGWMPCRFTSSPVSRAEARVLNWDGMGRGRGMCLAGVDEGSMASAHCQGTGQTTGSTTAPRSGREAKALGEAGVHARLREVSGPGWEPGRDPRRAEEAEQSRERSR